MKEKIIYYEILGEKIEYFVRRSDNCPLLTERGRSKLLDMIDDRKHLKPMRSSVVYSTFDEDGDEVKSLRTDDMAENFFEDEIEEIVAELQSDEYYRSICPKPQMTGIELE